MNKTPLYLNLSVRKKIRLLAANYLSPERGCIASINRSMPAQNKVFLPFVFWVLVSAGIFIFAAPNTLRAQSSPEVYRDRIEPHWLENGTQFWYRNDNPGDTREFILVDAEERTRQPAFDHETVADQMGEDIDPDQLPVASLEFLQSENEVRLIGDGRSWVFNTETGSLKEVERQDAGNEGLEPEERIRDSRNGGEETNVVFENKLDRPVALFWIDAGGNRNRYGTIQPGQKREQHTFAGHAWLVTDADGEEPLAAFVARRHEAVAVIDKDVPKPEERRRNRQSRRDATSVPSPNDKWEAFVRDHNLWLRNSESEAEFQLSEDGVESNSYHRDAIRERAIGMNYDRPDYPETLPEVIWSPDSRWLIALKTTVVPEPRVHLVESSPDDQLEPKLQSYPYIKPGGDVPQQIVRLFNVETRQEWFVDQSAFTNQWDLGRFRWEEDSSRFTFLFNQRGHQTLRVIAIHTGGSPAERDKEAQNSNNGSRRSRTAGEALANSSSAKTQILIDETAETFVDYSQKTHLDFLESRNEILWMSERDGWNHLYLFDADSGKLIRQLTQGEWVVRRVVRVDEESGNIWFWAMGIHPEQDPYHQHLCRLNLNKCQNGKPGEGVEILTAGKGTHSIQWSPDNRWFIDTWSRVDRPPVHELRDATDGTLVCKLEEADASEVTKAGYQFPERFKASGRDGQTPIYGIIHRPKEFDPDRSYPIVENIYAGPHGQHVPKSFRARYRHQQEIADRGFIVVQIDGMGTNWRSKEFHDVAWQNLKDAGFPDRIAWMKAAAKTRPWMDLSRVGVYGGSAGGQNAMRAVLDYSDFYKAAAADCGCHDNRMEKIWWNEAWMGWPVGDHYVKSSNMEDAHKLGGALLVTVGELDRNVDPSSTYQVVNALKEAGKTFEFMLMTGQGHGAAESNYGRKLRREFFERHLKPNNE